MSPRIRVAVLLLAAAPGAALAQARGWARADRPTAASYTPNPAFAFNSSGGPIVASRSETGVYAIRFAGLGGQGESGGSVHVTAYGRGPERCKPAEVDSTGADLVVEVRCFAPGGTPVDSRYSLRFAGPADTAPARRAYAWAQDPAAARYAPDPTFALNSGGGRIRARRHALGVYSIRFASLGDSSAPASVVVSATGSGRERCKIWRAASLGRDFQVRVRCFRPGGQRSDSRYSVGVEWPGTAVPSRRGFAWADNPTATTYVPSPAWSFNGSGGSIRAARTGIGVYSITFAGLGGGERQGGHVLVTAFGPDRGVNCKAADWSSGGPDFTVRVACLAPGGRPVDSRYNVSVAW